MFPTTSKIPGYFVVQIAAAILALLAAPVSFAASLTWTGSGTDWNTAGDWSSTVPGSANTAIFNSVGNGNLAVSLAASGTAKSITFTSGAGSYTLSGAGTLTLITAGIVSTDSLITGPESINNVISPGTGATATTYTFNSNSSNSSNVLNFGGNISGTNTIAGVISNGSSSALSLVKAGLGTWVLGGNNTYNGTTTLNAGTVILDYSTNTGNKLGASGATTLTLGGVNLVLSGGSLTESVLTTKVQGGGQINISRSSGTQKIALGALTQGWTSFTAGTPTMINFQSGVATTTNTTANTTNGATSILFSGGFATVGTTLGAYDWAAVDGSGNIVGYSTVNTSAGVGGYIALSSTQNASTGANFLVTDSVSTVQTSVNTLKIVTTSTSAQTLTLSSPLQLGSNGGILNSASGNYMITGSTLNLQGGATINQWGAGTLEIDSNIIGKTTVYLQEGGSGILILGGVNAWTTTNGFTINDGSVSVANDSNLGGASGTVTVVSSTAGSTTVTLSGVPATLVKGSSFLGTTVSSISGNTVTLSGTGANATLSNASAPYATMTFITLNGGTLEASATFSMTETGATVLNRGIVLGPNAANNGGNGGTIQVDPGAVLTSPGVISGLGDLTKSGSGTLVLSAANTYTGVTNINGGVLQVAATEMAGTSGPLGKQAAAAAGTILFGGGTLQYSASNTTDYSGRFSTAANQAISLDTNGQSVTFATALASSRGTLTKSGSGTLTLSAVNTFTGGTTIQGGTLALSSATSTNNIGNSVKKGDDRVARALQDTCCRRTLRAFQDDQTLRWRHRPGAAWPSACEGVAALSRH